MFGAAIDHFIISHMTAVGVEELNATINVNLESSHCIRQLQKLNSICLHVYKVSSLSIRSGWAHRALVMSCHCTRRTKSDTCNKILTIIIITKSADSAHHSTQCWLL